MTGRPLDGPLIWNVAGLLSDDIGATRSYDVADARPELPEGLELAEPIEGRVRLTRTNRGILAHGSLRTELAETCSRCLRPARVPLDLEIDEEFLPSLDLATGSPVPTEAEPDATRLTDHHELDLETPVREAIILAQPIAPLDRPDCPGLCPVCGEPLDEGAHDHPADEIDPRLAVLRDFQAEDA
jgi:uncharacterized protein